MTKEEILIGLLKEQNEDAFEAIYEKYNKLVFLVINNIVQDKEASKELTSDTFMKMYKHISSYDIKRKFSTWLTTIARNTAINYINRDKNKNLVYDEELVNRVEASEEPSENASTIITSTLEGIERDVVKLKIVDNFTYQEISEILNISVSEVFRKYRSGIQKIKSSYKK